MLLRPTKGTVFCLALVMLSPHALVRAQGGPPPQDGAQRTYRVIRQKIYEQVLDIVFSKDKPDLALTVFSFTLRFRPNDGPESQIVITRGVDKIEVVEHRPAEGGVYSKLNQALARGGREDAAELAKAIEVKRRSAKVSPEQVRKWQASFFESLNATNDKLREKGSEFDRSGHESVLSHGSQYDIWYEQSLNRMAFSLYDVDPDQMRSGAVFRLVEWMNSVRRDVEKLM